jgi:hypothetical protein
VRCVAIREGDEWRNALSVVLAFPAAQIPDHQASLRYGDVHLLESWVAINDLLPFVQAIRNGQAEIDGQVVSFAVLNSLQRIEQYPSNNELSPYPGNRYTATGAPVQNVPQDALLAYNLPFYTDPFHAMRDWTGVATADRQHLGHLGCVYLFLPECRARFTGFDYSEGRLSMKVVGDGADVSGLLIKGASGDGHFYTAFETPVSSPELSIQVAPEAEELEVYLIGPDETLYDWHHETPAWAFGQGRILHGPRVRGASEDTVLQAVSKGEGESIEFKAYVKFGEPKQDELVETVIAFANTHGGDLVIGVDDYCVVQGIEQYIIDKAAPNLTEAMKSYTGRFRKLLADQLNRSPGYDFEHVSISGHTVLLVKVSEGEDKPYFRTRDNAIFVRRGASNVRPDPDRELPTLFQKPELPF